MSQVICTDTAAGYQECTPEKIAAKLQEFQVIDVREPAEFTGELGHLDEAALVTLSTVERAATAWDKQAPILLVCRSGKRAGVAAEALCRMGFVRVHNLSGGMLAWREAESHGLLQ
jgi:rhodanese-related sulfurtransferase